MGTFHVVNPSGESDLYRYMRRTDLYQFADVHQIDYPKDAAAEIMKNLLRGSGVTPKPTDFVFQHDEKGNVLDARYKRLPANLAPRSRHADADEAKSREIQARRYAELDNLTDNRLKTLVKNQKGLRALELEPSREEMIAMLGGVKAEGVTKVFSLESTIVKTIDEPFDKDPTAEKIPDAILDMLTPMQLVKLCKQRGIEATIKDGKKVLLEKIRSHG